MKIIGIVVGLVLATILGVGQTVGQEYLQSVEMHVSWVPDQVMIDGKPSVYYELHLTNFAKDSFRLRKLEVSNTANATVIFSVGQDDLRKRYQRVGVTPLNKETVLPPGASSIIYLEFPLPMDKPSLPLAHYLEFERADGKDNKLLSVKGALILVAKKPPLILGPPLTDGLWAAIYEPAWERGHRRVVYTVDGKAQIPGRFAIDFIKLNSQGRYASDDENVVKNWYGHGADVLAVQDGIIASIRDDFPESETVSAHLKYSAEKATGNFISIDLGNNHIAFYEHLKPGSIKVKPGQKVKKGDVIASLGFTGQTTGPHLHFHVADKNSPLGAEGIPFVFEKFTFLGVYNDFEKFGKEPWIPVSPNGPGIKEERPAPNSVIKF